jgi:hypothetical protein
MLPLITRFNSNAVLYDSIGDRTNNYLSMAYDNSNFIYFLLQSDGTVYEFDKITKTERLVDIDFSSELPSVVDPDVIKIPQKYKKLHLKIGDPVNSIILNKNNLYGFEGFNVKKFTDNTVLYIKNNNTLIQESFDRQLKNILIQSSSRIIDFLIDDDFNYYVLHNKNQITKFNSKRIPLYKTTIRPTLSTVFNNLGILANDEIELFKIDYVREYTKDGLKSYPIILGNIKNGSKTIKPNELFLGKIDETVVGTLTQDLNIVSYANFTGLTANNLTYGSYDRTNYVLTNYEFLRNNYVSKDELVFRVVLENSFNNSEKNIVEIPISKKYFTTEYHHLAFRIDGIESLITVFCDGKEIQTVGIQKGQYIFQDLVRENMTIGKTYFHNNQTLDNVLNQPNYYYINNVKVKQFKMYKKALSNNEIEYHVYYGNKLNDLVVSLPCDQRNELDGIDRQFKLNTTGNKSNKINIIIKNSNITNDYVQQEMKAIILDKLQKVLPSTVTINEIDFR